MAVSVDGGRDDTPAAEARVVALTPAHNEAEHIGSLITSMLAQERVPDLWVIADDGSSDGTGDVARRLSGGAPFIYVIEIPRGDGRRLSSKAEAVSAAYRAAIERCPEANFIASVDADVGLPPNAFSFILDRFEQEANLGVAGGVYMQPVDDRRVAGRVAPSHVPGPFQVFRREVFDAVGGYRPLRDGGLDTVANAHARMLGWKTHAFDDLTFSHNRRMGTGGGRHPVVAEYHGGCRDRSLGVAPLYELAKCARRTFDPPMLAGSLARLIGYGFALLTRRPSDVPADVAAFIRGEQMDRLLFRSSD